MSNRVRGLHQYNHHKNIFRAASKNRPSLRSADRPFSRAIRCTDLTDIHIEIGKREAHIR